MNVLCDLVTSAKDLYLFLEAHGSVYSIFLRHCADVEGQRCSVQYTRLFGVWDVVVNASYSVS